MEIRGMELSKSAIKCDCQAHRKEANERTWARGRSRVTAPSAREEWQRALLLVRRYPMADGWGRTNVLCVCGVS